MATFTIIASWGGDTSNAYVDLTYANAYMDTKIKKSAWDSATEPERIASLVEATRTIDSKNWNGVRFYYSQRLEFPRTAYDEREGWPEELTTTQTATLGGVEYIRMEERVKDACCEQALYMLETKDDEMLNLQRRGVTSYSESVGRVSESYSFGSGARTQLAPEATRLLAWYKSHPRIQRA
jgi:hypothetical protein